MPRALKQKTAVSLHGIRAITSKGEQRITLTVKPIVDPKNDTMMVLISFESIKPVDVNATTDTVSNIDDLSRDRMQTLETELRFTKENLQATIEELETSNEELQATNEELVASNEELQSTNEELHSVNEELYTVNAEYQRKIYELTQLTDDFENLFRSTEVGTIFLDLDLCIRKFTPQIASIFHLVPQDIGRRLTGFSHQIEGLVIEDDLMAVVESEQTIEKEVSDKFGNWYLLRVLPYRAKGRSEGVILTMINITKLKQAQASLRSSDMRLEGILEHSPALIFVKDKDGRYLLTNQHCHQKLGVAGAEAIGKTDAELLPEDVARLIRNNDLDVLRQGKAIEFEETVPTASGPRTFLSIKFPLRDPLLGCETVCAIATDITRLKLIEAEQREALQGRDQFLAMLSHELRNPLAAILNSAYLVQTQSESEPFETTVVKNAVSVIDRQSRQMATLLDDLLDISRITQNKFDIRRSVVDVRSTVSDALQAVAPIVKSRSQEVIVDLDPNPLWVWGDQSRLQQVQVNLLANAAKYSPPGKRIWLTQRVIDDEIQILVRDEGNGIPESLIGTIFDMFVQVGDSLDRRDGGMGVGLTLVRSIVELHGGKIEARSGGTDQGSEFEIRLPRSAAPNVAAGSQNGVSKAVAKSSVLLVEDNADSRETLSQLLGLYGCRVSVAATGYEALDIMYEERFDVAIIDIGLPGLTGFDVARRIRSDRRNDGMFLVALTGYGQPADRLQAKEAGFDEHLIKPIMPEHLESLLQS